ncbi:hypothetical protein HK104_003321 [Borealophlyctis nickersoniae]|nr:hypothetical protein HK104_003321 [Borealophlyctis nickersoniae]
MSKPYVIPSSSVVVDRTSKPIGSGGFGIVRKGTWCGTPVAVKVLKCQTLTERELKHFVHEAKTNHAIPRHTNIVAFFGIIDEQGHYALVMELMPKGSLYALIDSGQSLAWDRRRRIARDIACGMFCLHEGNVFHCDLKSVNVLLAEDGTAKVADFGLSDPNVTSVIFVKHLCRKIITEHLVTSFNDVTRNIGCVDGNEFTALSIIGGTVLWKAPELFTFYPKYTKECDVFSYGITLTELFTMAGPYGIDFDTVQLEPLIEVVKSGQRPELPSVNDIPDDLWKSSRNNDNNTTYDTPVTASGSVGSTYSTPSFSSPVTQGSSRQPIDGGNQHSDGVASDVASLTQQLDNLNLQLRDLSKKMETLEDLVDNETNPILAEPLQTHLKNYQSRKADLRAERTRVREQIRRLSPATQLRTPTTTPPKSASSTSSESASIVNPTDPEKLYEMGREADLRAERTHVREQIRNLSPATQLPTPTATPPKSASTSLSESAASIVVNPTDPENEMGRKADLIAERTPVTEQIPGISPAAQLPTPTATPPKSFFGRVREQISRLSPAAQLPNPIATPPKSASPSSSESAASIVNPTDPEKSYEMGRKADLGAERTRVTEQIPGLSPAAQLSNPAATPPKSTSTSSSESVASIVNPTDPAKLYEMGRALDPAHGDEESRNHSAAFKWYHKAAIAGHLSSQVAVGFQLQGGLGVEKDATKAAEWFRKAADQLTLRGEYNPEDCGLGVGKDLRMAVHWYEKAAEQGDADAQNGLGYCHQHGVGVAKDVGKAVKWYEKAAEQGLAAAQNNLGDCYKHGIGVEEDKKKAAEWYKRAAKQGDAVGQCHLGWCYQHGIGVAKNETTAAKWYKKAAEQGHAEAQDRLGNYYRDKDKRKAVEWYKMAAEQGYADGQFNFGDCYYSGFGVAQDRTRGVEWLRKAAAQGNAAAKNRLAWVRR